MDNQQDKIKNVVTPEEREVLDRIAKKFIDLSLSVGGPGNDFIVRNYGACIFFTSNFGNGGLVLPLEGFTSAAMASCFLAKSIMDNLRHLKALDFSDYEAIKVILNEAHARIQDTEDSIRQDSGPFIPPPSGN